MDVQTLLIFLTLVLLGTYVQSVTGFAMGMIITATAGGTMLVPIPILAAVVSLLSLINVCLSLRGNEWRHVNTGLFTAMALGQVPAIGLGLWLLVTLDSSAQDWLYLVLGSFVALGSLSMTLRPVTLPAVSAPSHSFVAGFVGGVVGGLFSASGPVMGWFNYRQPLPLREIRATLFSCFFVTTSVRTILVGASGGLTVDVWTLAGLALPVVLFGTWVGRRWPPRLSEQLMKRIVFGLLLLMGLWIVANASWSLLA